MNKPNPFQTLGSRIVYQNPWIRVREDSIIRPDGKEGLYGVIEVKDSVAIAAVNQSGEVCLVHVYRYPAQQWRWELPMGGVDGQDPETAACRELQEESGFTAANWERLGSYRAHTGLLTERQTIFVASGLTSGAATDTAEGIDNAAFFSLEDVDKMIDAGDIDDSLSLAALYHYQLWLARQPRAAR